MSKARAIPEAWWWRASDAQRLAQIDGGIECGLTLREIGICLGLGNRKSACSEVREFGVKHGRKFTQRREGARITSGDVKKAYWHGARDFSDRAIMSSEVEFSEVSNFE